MQNVTEKTLSKHDWVVFVTLASKCITPLIEQLAFDPVRRQIILRAFPLLRQFRQSYWQGN